MSTSSGAFPSLGFATSFASGVLLHVFVFRIGEWDLYTTKILRGLAAVSFGLALGLKVLEAVATGWSYDFRGSITLSLCLVFSMVAGLLSSMVIYRLSFCHRLHGFSGPFLARLSNLYITQCSVKNFHLYEEIQNLHRTYGDIVRVGPFTLSVVNAEAFHAIHANSSPCVKGPWYNIEQPAISLHMSRDKEAHSRRRKAWDRAFNAKALYNYEPRVAEYASQLLNRLEETRGMPFNISKWFGFYSFDVMGDLAFGKSFGMLTEGVEHPFMSLVHTHMAMAGTFSHLVWMFPLFRAIPFANCDDVDFQRWLVKQLRHREQNQPDVPDVFSWLLSEYESLEKPSKQDRMNLEADMQLIAVAGSDTTSATLSCLFFLLVTNKVTYDNLQNEIDEFFLTYSQPNHSRLSKLKYLQACINEALRLFPPVPSGLQLMTPRQGLQVGEIFIPGNTIVTVPSYTMFRDERFFPSPNDFIPERWTTRPELVKDASIFAPFSVGRYACVGKQLGLMEVRYVTCLVLHRFTAELAGNKSASTSTFLAGLKDRFTLAVPDLEMVFTTRTS
ncbi:hypothetical protein AU210_015891 [Fusarium oxysporum f. sp. radicis-cucumerinum]|uniref:Pisatin demethylase cytochrome P450 n=1 Tax=Fusarium oxysporum f. sp. radicis-cucumerinum TaxID=327505 RepID=A0A2H3FRT8_FUSOX|nr:hypothetical protein AU210_015891 [Fusarium oxysporum f. sp. radicis-cucumerinum]